MSKKTDKKRKKGSVEHASQIETRDLKVLQDQNNDNDIKYLSQLSILLDTNRETRSDTLQVPPTTPRNLIPDFEVNQIPQQLPKLTNIPWVREIGVKEMIKKLAEVYGCKQFHWNCIQFWFLDFVTDILWRVQDEYQFSEKHQKIVLEWVLYIFNLIRAPDMNLTRKQIFKIFNEAITAVEHHIENGAASIPYPEELFELKVYENEEVNHLGDLALLKSGSDSSLMSSLSENNENLNRESFLAIQFQDGFKFFDLPSKLCHWDTDEDYMSSSIETISEDEMVFVTRESENIEEERDVQNVNMMYEDFYKPDLLTPPRFKPSSETVLDDSISITLSDESVDSIEIEEEDDEAVVAPNWFEAKRKFPDVPCPSKIFDIQSNESTENEKKREEEILQSWFDYHVWQLRKADMDDPKKGWVPPSDVNSESVVEVAKSKLSATELAQQNLLHHMDKMKHQIREMKRNQFVNTCAVMAIKQIVFFDHFQFTIMKIAYRYPQFLITQELNTEWCIPKKFKGEIKRPKPRKKKVEKVKAQKKEKGSKKDKSKSSKKSKSSAKAKSSKSSKKSAKGGKKDKPKKKKGLTKEEKAEIARLKNEMKLREEMEKKAEENKNFMFPLSDAAEDSLFESLFSNWVKPKKAKREKQEKEKKSKN